MIYQRDVSHLDISKEKTREKEVFDTQTVGLQSLI